MRTKTTMDIASLYDALRALEKAKAALYAGKEPMLAGQVGGLSRSLECVIETFEVIECRSQIQNSMQK